VTAVLGRPLPPVEYLLPDGRPKRVVYWAAQPVSASDHPTDPAEIDGTAWVSPERARRMLPHPGQAAPQDALVDLARQGYTDTRAMVVVRHADALHRREWSGADPDRPLTALGRREAAALIRLLACWRPARLVSSTSRRCVDTVAGYAEATGLVLHTDPVMSEEGFTAHPDGVRRWVTTLIGSPEPSLVCTHRPVLAVLMHELAGYLAGTATGAPPDRDPFLRPGEVLVAHITGTGADPRVVAVERHHPAVTA
jgi:8-oxo-dGTP diphosphatase